MISEPAKLESRITQTEALTCDEREQMRGLMSRNFINFDLHRFELDLVEKPWTILLCEGSGKIAGFSTLDIMETTVDARQVKAVYSGDTIIEARHRSTTALPRAFLGFISHHTSAGRDDCAWYWFYVCKGYRTYRFLPVFYREFFPHPEMITPVFERCVMEQLARLRFRDDYDPVTGIVSVSGDYALRVGVGDVTHERLRDPFIRFFSEQNPNWAIGEELVCLASLNPHNLCSKPRRWLDFEMAK